MCGVATYFILPDYPQTAEFLLPHERDAIVSRLAAHAPTKLAKTWDTKQVTALLKDPTFWSFSVVWFCHAVGGFGLSYVLPTVIHDLGMLILVCTSCRRPDINRTCRLYGLCDEQRADDAAFNGRVHLVDHPRLASRKTLLESVSRRNGPYVLFPC